MADPAELFSAVPTDDDFYKRLMDSLYDAVYFVDRQRKITYWNKAAEKLSGYSEQDVLGRCCAENMLMHVDDEGCQLCTGNCPLSRAMEEGSPCEAEIYLRHKLGYRIPVAARIAPIFDKVGQVVGAVEIFNDNASKKTALEKSEQLEKLAFLDPVTQVGNRRYLESKILQHLYDYSLQGNVFGVLILDLDKFKHVNDNHGHNAGDVVLQTTAKTLAACLRASDIVGRWGGDEFIAILPDVDEQRLLNLGERCRVLVRESGVLFEDRRITITISMGGALVQAGDSMSSLIKRADEVLYQSKKNGGNRLTLSAA